MDSPGRAAGDDRGLRARRDLQQQPVTLLLYAYGPIGQFAPVVFATLYVRRATGPGVFSGLLVGSIVTVLLGLAPDQRPWPIHAGVYGLVANVSTMYIVSLLTRRRCSASNDRFLDVAAGRSSREIR